MQKDFCLLIPCYNNYEGLLRSLRTVHYDKDRFEVLIVDDGSKQPVSLAQLKKDLQADYAITILTNEKNQGITRTLNNGLKWIVNEDRFNYVARLDCGDRCMNDRFYEQVAVLNADKKLGLIGSWCRFEDTEGRGYEYKTPSEDAEIRRQMYNRNLFIHPTVMFGVSAVNKVGLYPYGFEYAEDYALFWELMKEGKVGIIKKILVITEITKNGISFGNNTKQIRARWKVVKRYGSSWARKVAGFLRLFILFISPKELTLWLKGYSK